MLHTQELNGDWKFVIDPENRGLTWAQYQLRTPEHAGDRRQAFSDLQLATVPVPGCWQLYAPELTWYHGTAFFFNSFKRPAVANERTFITFAGISFRAEAWLNGEPIGSIDYPYLPWQMEITDHLAQENHLVVRIEGDSRPDDTVPVFGWQKYSGILRSVALGGCGHSRFEHVHVDSEIDLAKGLGRLRFRIARDNPADNVALSWRIGGDDGRDERVDAVGATWEGQSPWLPVEWWDVHSPMLYDLSLSLWDTQTGKELDRYDTKIGFRRFETTPEGFRLNGRDIWLKGISRHQLHPDIGMADTPATLDTDFDLIQELGCNAVRLPHYPQDSMVLDECDRRGLLVWVEIPVYWDAPLDNPTTQRRMTAQMSAMVARDYNHPAVVIWSMANEITSDAPDVIDLFRRTRADIRAMDPNRPITFANNNPALDSELQQTDICCLNRYRGWYDPAPEAIVADLQALHERFPNQPLILSEFGAGAVAALRGDCDEPWTEDYQAALLTQLLTLAAPHVAGCFVWVLADFADPSRVSMTVSNGFHNNKGLVDERRTHRKLGYAAVQDFYRGYTPLNTTSDAATTRHGPPPVTSATIIHHEVQIGRS